MILLQILYNLIYNECLFTNLSTKKHLMQNVRDRKKYPASTNPKKKIHCELRG